MDLIIIINLCGKDDYLKFEVEEINSERAKDFQGFIYKITWSGSIPWLVWCQILPDGRTLISWCLSESQAFSS